MSRHTSSPRSSRNKVPDDQHHVIYILKIIIFKLKKFRSTTSCTGRNCDLDNMVVASLFEGREVEPNTLMLLHDRPEVLVALLEFL